MQRSLLIVLTGLLLCFAGENCWGAGLGYGARAIAMGGAFTAIATGDTAVYWNPAGMTQQKYLNFSLGWGGNNDWNNALDLFDDYSFPPRYENLDLSAFGNLGVTTKWVALNSFAEITGYTRENYLTGVFQGEAVGIGYAVLSFAKSYNEKLSVGVNIKQVYTKTAAYHGEYYNLDDPDSNWRTNTDGDGWAFDLGLLWKTEPNLQIGVMVRNLAPEITCTGSITKYQYTDPYSENSFTTKLKLPQEVVVGFAYYPVETLLIAVDLTQETTDAQRFKIQFGMEKASANNDWFFRWGLFHQVNGDYGVTTGVGGKLGPVNIDVAAFKESRTNELGWYLTAGVSW